MSDARLTWKQAAGRTTGPQGYTFGDFTRSKIHGVKQRVAEGVQQRLIEAFIDLYVITVKPMLTPDKWMPEPVQRAKSGRVRGIARLSIENSISQFISESELFA